MAKKVYSPKTLYQAIAPMRIANWIVATSVFEYPQGLLRPGITFVYHTVFLAIYGFMVHLAMADLLRMNSENTPELGVIFYRIIIFGNTGLGFLGIILGWLRREESQRCIGRLIDVDDSLGHNMSISNVYRKIFFAQLCQLVEIVAVLMIMIVYDAVWLLPKRVQRGHFIPVSITLHYPIVASAIADFTFVGLLRYLEQRFRSLNDLLAELAKDLNPRQKRIRAIYQKAVKVPAISERSKTNDESYLGEKLRSVQKFRKMHLELCNIAGQLNATYGLQLLLSMGSSSVLMTGFLFNGYLALDDSGPDAIKQAISLVCWAILYGLKILLVNRGCANASSEAQRTGEIIFDLQKPVAGKALREEIEEFSLDLLQTQLKFTARGFFTLDYTFVSGVVGSVTTYLVILIQLSTKT